MLNRIKPFYRLHSYWIDPSRFTLDVHRNWNQNCVCWFFVRHSFTKSFQHFFIFYQVVLHQLRIENGELKMWMRFLPKPAPNSTCRFEQVENVKLKLWLSWILLLAAKRSCFYFYFLPSRFIIFIFSTKSFVKQEPRNHLRGSVSHLLFEAYCY